MNYSLSIYNELTGQRVRLSEGGARVFDYAPGSSRDGKTVSESFSIWFKGEEQGQRMRDVVVQMLEYAKRRSIGESSDVYLIAVRQGSTESLRTPIVDGLIEPLREGFGVRENCRHFASISITRADWWEAEAEDRVQIARYNTGSSTDILVGLVNTVYNYRAFFVPARKSASYGTVQIGAFNGAPNIRGNIPAPARILAQPMDNGVGTNYRLGKFIAGGITRPTWPVGQRFVLEAEASYSTFNFSRVEKFSGVDFNTSEASNENPALPNGDAIQTTCLMSQLGSEFWKLDVSKTLQAQAGDELWRPIVRVLGIPVPVGDQLSMRWTYNTRTVNTVGNPWTKVAQSDPVPFTASQLQIELPAIQIGPPAGSTAVLPDAYIGIEIISKLGSVGGGTYITFTVDCLMLIPTTSFIAMESKTRKIELTSYMVDDARMNASYEQVILTGEKVVNPLRYSDKGLYLVPGVDNTIQLSFSRDANNPQSANYGQGPSTYVSAQIYYRPRWRSL